MQLRGHHFGAAAAFRGRKPRCGERDNFVVISDDELKEAAPDKSAAIEIQEFVNESLGNPARNRAASAGQREAGPERSQSCLQLIEGMTAEFDPAKYHDTYTADVKKLVDAKAKGQKRQPPPSKPARSNVRPGRGLAGEPGAEKAVKTRRCLTRIRSDAIYRGRPPRSAGALHCRGPDATTKGG
jgi:hypothetical protein